METLYRTPTKCKIKFEGLSNECKRMLFPLLNKFWKKNIETLLLKEKYEIGFRINGEWHYKRLTAEIYNKLMEKFDEQHFIFDLDETLPEYFYEEGREKLPDWSLFSKLSFSIYQRYKKIDGNYVKINHNNDNDSSFFQYLISENCPKIIVTYLKRLQILDSLVSEEYYDVDITLQNKTKKTIFKIKYEQQELINDCCFIYELTQAGCYNENFLNSMRLRIQNRYLSQDSFELLCQEFRIHIKLTSIDESRNKNGVNHLSSK